MAAKTLLPTRRTRSVDSSMSLNRNVTVPRGNGALIHAISHGPRSRTKLPRHDKSTRPSKLRASRRRTSHSAISRSATACSIAGRSSCLRFWTETPRGTARVRATSSMRSASFKRSDQHRYYVKVNAAVTQRRKRMVWCLHRRVVGQHLGALPLLSVRRAAERCS
jgi:hypothetical protein